jgi:hypothetical protein
MAVVGVRRRTWWPLGCAVALLFGGYLPLLAFWHYGSYPPGVPGLFDYRSATWGDGFLLPLLVFCLGVLITGLPKLPRSQPTILAASAGAVAGALVIVTWLADSSPVINWTMPRPHRLNAAGAWHAVFLVGASALFAGLWVELLRRLRSADPETARRRLGSAAAVGAVAGTAGYAWLATADSGRAGGTAAGRASLIALTAAALLLMACLIWAGRGALQAGVSTAITGSLTAAVVLMFAGIHERNALIYCAIIGAVGAGLCLASASGRDGSFSQEMLAVPALFVGLVLLVVVRNVELRFVVLVPFVAVICSVLLRVVARRSGHARAGFSLEYLAAAGISASLLAAGVFGLWLNEQSKHAYITGGFLLTLVGAVLGGVFLPYFKSDYERLMRVEGDPTIRRSDNQPGSEQARAAADAWPRLLGYAVSAFTSMLVLTIALGPSLGWQAGHAHPDWAVPVLAVIAVALLLAPAGVAFVQALKWHPPKGPRRSPTGTPGAVWWCCTGGIAACGFLLSTLLRDWSAQPFAIFQSILITMFALLSILGNAAWLNLGRVRWSSRVAISTVTFTVLAIVYWSLTAAVRPGGLPATPGAAILGWVMAVLMVVLLVVVTAAAVYVAGGRPYMTDYPPGLNVAQDTFHLVLLWFVLGWLPQFVLANVPPSSPERWAAIGSILAGFLLLFGPAFLWVLENNDTHVERQRRIRKVDKAGVLAQLADATSSAARIRTLPPRIAELARSVRRSNPDSADGAEAREFLVRLSGHTAVQNALAMTLAAISVIGVIGISAGLSPNATGVDSLKGGDG